MSKKMLLDIRNVCMSYNSISGVNEVLEDISFQINEGEFICVLGPNGCGKSTLLKIIGGFVKPTSGFITVDSKRVIGPGADRPFILQDYDLFNWMTVFDNVAFGLKSCGKNKDEVKEVVSSWFKKLSLEGFENHYPFELSGGMKQKVAIARALVINSGIILMDEPFASLDIQVRYELQAMISQLFYSMKKTVLMVTHSIEEAVYLADKVILMTERPIQIRKVVTIDYSRPRDYSFKSSKTFLESREKILELLDKNYKNEERSECISIKKQKVQGLTVV